jgi:hypothetical protein
MKNASSLCNKNEINKKIAKESKDFVKKIENSQSKKEENKGKGNLQAPKVGQTMKKIENPQSKKEENKGKASLQTPTVDQTQVKRKRGRPRKNKDLNN